MTVQSLLLVGLSLPALAQAPQPAAAPPLQIALTFDDLPAHGELPPDTNRLQVAQSILATLAHEHLPPTYGFINAAKLEDASPATRSVLGAWRAAGNPLGSHTWSHIDLDTTSAELFEADVEKNEPTLKQLAGSTDWRWLRYPYLHEGNTLAKQQEIRHFLLGHGYRIAEVTMDFEDYLWNAPYARCMAKHDDAAIAHLHDTYLATADQYIAVFRSVTHTLYGRDIPYVLLLHIGAFDARMLPDLLALFRSRGFTFTSLPEAEQDPAYAADPAIGYPGGGALQEMLAAARKVKFPPNSKPYKELEATCR